jgi:hypothetical protein
LGTDWLLKPAALFVSAAFEAPYAAYPYDSLTAFAWSIRSETEPVDRSDTSSGSSPR